MVDWRTSSRSLTAERWRQVNVNWEIGRVASVRKIESVKVESFEMERTFSDVKHARTSSIGTTSSGSEKVSTERASSVVGAASRGTMSDWSQV